MDRSKVERAAKPDSLEKRAELVAALERGDSLGIQGALASSKEANQVYKYTFWARNQRYSIHPVNDDGARRLIDRAGRVGAEQTFCELETLVLRPKSIPVDYCIALCGMLAPEPVDLIPNVRLLSVEAARAEGVLVFEHASELDPCGLFGKRACVLVERKPNAIRVTESGSRPRNQDEQLAEQKKEAVTYANALSLAAGSGVIPAAYWTSCGNSFPLFADQDIWDLEMGADIGDRTHVATPELALAAGKYLEMLKCDALRKSAAPISWFRRASQVKHIYPDQALIYMSIAFEGLLTNDKPREDPIAMTLALRGSYLQADSIPERRELFKWFKDLYTMRSDLVHGEDLKSMRAAEDLAVKAVAIFPDFVRRLARIGKLEEKAWTAMILGEPRE